MPKQWNLRQHEKWFLQVSFCVESHNIFVHMFIVLMMCVVYFIFNLGVSVWRVTKVLCVKPELTIVKLVPVRTVVSVS